MSAFITHFLALFVGAVIGFAACAWLSAGDVLDERHLRECGPDDE